MGELKRIVTDAMHLSLSYVYPLSLSHTHDLRKNFGIPQPISHAKRRELSFIPWAIALFNKSELGQTVEYSI